MFRRFLSSYDVTPFVFFEGDKGATGGDGDPKEGDKSDGDDPEKKSGSTEGTPEVSFKTKAEYQAHIDGIVKDRLDREAKKAERAAADAKAKADEDALKSQAKFEELATKQAKRLAELEPVVTEAETLKGEVDRYKAALNAQLEAARKDLPAPIIELLDGLDPIAQMDWIAKNAAELVGKDGKPIIKASPKAADKVSRDDLIKQEIEAQRSRNR